MNTTSTTTPTQAVRYIPKVTIARPIPQEYPVVHTLEPYWQPTTIPQVMVRPIRRTRHIYDAYGAWYGSLWPSYNIFFKLNICIY